MLVAGETNGRDPRGSLVNERGEEKKVQRDGGYGVAGVVARGGGDGFAYGFDGGAPPFLVFAGWLEQDSKLFVFPVGLCG
ncbi:MAG: hypothetical protein WDN23_07485 [Edaphobacter sp.]